jgi:GNAT superfamily N-acetyltransferase
MRRPGPKNADRADAARAAGYCVRRLEAADVQRAAEVHMQVWREAYADLMPAEYLSGLDPRRLAQRRLEHLTNPQTPEIVDVVGVDPTGEIVAMAVAGPGRDENAPTAWELWAINVLASEHGTGLADLIMRDVLGERAAYLWVLRDNERARAFYGRHGFRPDGSTRDHPPTGVLEIRMTRPAKP